MLSLSQIRQILRLSKPIILSAAVLMYILGTGIAHYLGATIQWGFFWIGLTWILLIQLSMHYLDSLFDSTIKLANSNQSPVSDSGDIDKAKLPPRWIIMAFIGTCLTVAASLSLTIIRVTRFEPTASLILLIIFLGAFLYATPPFRLSASGFGELINSLMISVLIPTLALFIQLGELHRLVAMINLPLAALQMAMYLAHELQDYGTDLITGKKNLMIRLGWERGMLMHNLLILFAFGLLGLGLLFGLPVLVGGPALLAMSLGALQIWMMRQISDGAKPNWVLLKFSSSALFGVTAYILTFMFWTR